MKTKTKDRPEMDRLEVKLNFADMGLRIDARRREVTLLVEIGSETDKTLREAILKHWECKIPMLADQESTVWFRFLRPWAAADLAPK
jgi:hypothetical protein